MYSVVQVLRKALSTIENDLRVAVKNNDLVPIKNSVAMHCVVLEYCSDLNDLFVHMVFLRFNYTAMVICGVGFVSTGAGITIKLVAFGIIIPLCFGLLMMCLTGDSLTQSVNFWFCIRSLKN